MEIHVVWIFWKIKINSFIWKTHEYRTTVSHILNRLSFYQRVVFFSHCCSLFCLCGFEWNNTQQMRIDFWQCEENSPEPKTPKPKGCKAVCLQNVYGWSHTWSNMSASYNTRLSGGILKCNQPYKAVFPGLLWVCSPWGLGREWDMGPSMQAEGHCSSGVHIYQALWPLRLTVPLSMLQQPYWCWFTFTISFHCIKSQKRMFTLQSSKNQRDGGHFVNKDQFIWISNKCRNQMLLSHNISG